MFVCISPWNFPLAIFMGQVSAALLAGNSVLAKPAEQTPRIARMAVDLLHACGVPAGALQLVAGAGDVGAALVNHPGIAGVAFTGGTDTAARIQVALAGKSMRPIVPFIAETGGQNVMIADSSALIEQTTDDVIRSAFLSAGQRCSALRVLCVQNEVADTLAGVDPRSGRGTRDRRPARSLHRHRADHRPAVAGAHRSAHRADAVTGLRGVDRRAAERIAGRTRT